MAKLRVLRFLFLLMVSTTAGPLWSQVSPQVGNSPSSSPTAGAQKLLDAGRLDEALKVLDVLASQQPEPAGVERLRGMAYYEQGQVQSSAAAFERALTQDPADREVDADGRRRALPHRPAGGSDSIAREGSPFNRPHQYRQQLRARPRAIWTPALRRRA